MTTWPIKDKLCAVLFALICSAPAFGEGPPVKIVVLGPTPISFWNEVATNTINLPPSASGTAAEMRPTNSADLATVHIAIYDALMAITHTHLPFAMPLAAAPTDGHASQRAAIGAAAFGVLAGLFPDRADQYQSAYSKYVAGIPDNDAKTRGLTIGAEAAAGALALRAKDGRSIELPPYVPLTEIGRFRSTDPVGRYMPYLRPFALEDASQFRVPPPPDLDSAIYSHNFDETRTLGGNAGTLRTEAQLEIAKFHTEAPVRF